MSGVSAIPAGRSIRGWRALLPDGWAWVRICASPSSYLLLLAFTLTASAKLRVLAATDGVTAWPLWGAATAAPDAALCAGLAALFARGERRLPWFLVITVPLAALVAVVAVVNSAYLGITGEQLTWQAVSLGLDRFGDVSGIVGEEAARLGWQALAAALVVGGVPLAALWILRRGGRSLHPVALPGRAHATGLCAALALAVVLCAPQAPLFAVERLGANAVLRTYWGWLTQDPQGSAEVWFEGYTPYNLVAPEAIARLRAADAPSVVLLVMESTGRAVTGLAGPGAPARTPNLEKLAAAGLEMTGARAVVPHTTKSLFSIMCARLPLMQLSLLETSAAIDVQCLPAILRAAGWRTGFFQSSVGVFEDRPRLVQKFGFENFAAWEDIGGEPLGYLGSDDLSLAGALAGWLDRAPDPQRPFLATLLTSSTHHPYRLSASAEARAQAEGRPASTARERHARLVEEEDRLLGQVSDLLRQRGLDRRTVVIAIGDHGEGFGEKGIRQHDNNFFEEGLHVPWVMAGPGVAHARVGGDASLVDVAPTILALLGVELSPGAMLSVPGRSLLGGPSDPRLLVFYCWYDAHCRGFVEDGKKVVFVPESNIAFWFDLAADPEERQAKRLTDEQRARLHQANHLVDSHRTREWPDERVPMTDYPPWNCPAKALCHHPRSPPGGLFGAP